MKKYNKNKQLKKEQTGGGSIAGGILGLGGKNLYAQARGVFTGNPTFQGGPFGFGGEAQLAGGLNPATQNIQDKEQEELDQNVTDQIWSLGKYLVGSGPNKFVDFTTGRDAIPTTVTEQSPIDNSISRMRDLPGFPKMNSLVNKKQFMPPEEENKDKVYLGPTIDNVPLQELISSIAEEVLNELLNNPSATFLSRKGWNNIQINSLASQKNHLHPGEEPAPSWRPLFKDPIDPYESENIPPADKSPIGGMGAIGWPKKYIPNDFEQDIDNEGTLSDPLSSKRLQSPPLNNNPTLGGAPSISETATTQKNIYPNKNNKLDNTTGDLNLDGKGPDGAADSFEKSHKDILKNLIDEIVSEVTLPTIKTIFQKSPRLEIEPGDLKTRAIDTSEPFNPINFNSDFYHQLKDKEIEIRQRKLRQDVLKKEKEREAQLKAKPVYKKTPKVPVPVSQTPLSSNFINSLSSLVKQLENSPIKQTEKDKLLANLWKVGVDPKKSEDEKISTMQQYVASKIKEHPIDFNKLPNSEIEKKGFLDKLKKTFGLSESEAKLLENILVKGKR